MDKQHPADSMAWQTASSSNQTHKHIIISKHDHATPSNHVTAWPLSIMQHQNTVNQTQQVQIM